MSNVDLTTNIGKLLKLRNPFWIASAHFSDRESAIDAWEELAPAALTLKTSHQSPKTESKKSVRYKTIPTLSRFGRSFYCDGPKQKELLTYDRTSSLLGYAEKKLPQTVVGISVIADSSQDYEALRRECKPAKFCELNLKYSFRRKDTQSESFLTSAQSNYEALMAEVRRFLTAFEGLSVFVKLPRELTWLPKTSELVSLLTLLQDHQKAGLIVANSRKMDIPTFLDGSSEINLQGGVMCGEHLFDETLSLLDAFEEECRAREIPIVATGGMISPENVLTALRAGASAVQLCTAFDYQGLHFYNTLCWQLQSRIENRGLRAFSDYLARLREEGVASIENMPFMYFPVFWGEEVQKRMRIDVTRSRKMDVLVMSGKTVVNRWDDVLRSRARKGLGVRVLLPNPEGTVFAAIQNSWGLTGGPELEGRKQRIRDAREKLLQIWSEEAQPATIEAGQKKENDSGGALGELGPPAGQEEKTESEQKLAKPEVISNSDQEEESNPVRVGGNAQVFFSNQCPFYSFYLFDDKVYVAPYPFTRPGELASPVYVFFVGSHEYSRIAEEADVLSEYAKQTSQDQP